jgi:hypothetical protein
MANAGALGQRQEDRRGRTEEKGTPRGLRGRRHGRRSFKDTSSVAMNPVISSPRSSASWRSYGGAVDRRRRAQPRPGGGVLAVSVVFVWRSFTGMRIRTGATPPDVVLPEIHPTGGEPHEHDPHACRVAGTLSTSDLSRRRQSPGKGSRAGTGVGAGTFDANKDGRSAGELMAKRGFDPSTPHDGSVTGARDRAPCRLREESQHQKLVAVRHRPGPQGHGRQWDARRRRLRRPTRTGRRDRPAKRPRTTGGNEGA